MESQKAVLSLVEDSSQFSRMRPCLAVLWHWCVTDVRGHGSEKFKKKIPGGEVITEMVLLQLSNSPQ